MTSVRKSPPFESQPIQKSTRNDDEKKGQVRWDMGMDILLLDVFEKEANEGRKHGNFWSAQAWKNGIAALLVKNSIINKRHIESRFRIMKSKYHSFLELKGKSGAGWDSTRNSVTFSDAKWVELLETPKCRDKWAKFKDKGLEWDETKLEVVIGKDNATGVDRLGGMNCMNIGEYDNTNAEESIHVVDPTLVHNLDGDYVSTNFSALLGKRGPQYDKEK
ncbi:hypothetical protein GIB67_025158 [Kingdonia uniflora]|uniref:Myb/SANT-like domain-containing protein n=1 Tax=Kingdonia uniflora TaxID=39325 RepID=A0A7J7N8D5_9MAGN|nr:hypothetical protein GIB67_025158 [Kingdonia uniflora]